MSQSHGNVMYLAGADGENAYNLEETGEGLNSVLVVDVSYDDANDTELNPENEVKV